MNSGPSSPVGQFITVDLGGTNVRVGIGNPTDGLLHVCREPTALVDVCDQLDRMARLTGAGFGVGWPAVQGAVIGIPANVHPRTGLVDRATNIPAINGLDLRTVLARTLAKPVLIEKDVVLAGLAELRLGAGRGARILAYLSIGTGIAVSTFIDGRVLRGAEGAAGEIGLFPSMNASRSTLALREFETSASGPGLFQRYLDLTGRTGGPARAVESGEAVFAAAQAGVSPAVQVLADEVIAIAKAVLCVIGVLDPDIVVLGGGLGRQPALVSMVEAALAPALEAPTRLVPATFGDDGGMLGGLLLTDRLQADQP